ncbi:A-kinase anchor protein 17B isoform X2 [Castor canadensis]
MFDRTKHFSEGAIRKRNQERLKLQELEEERKKEKKREEEIAERKRKDEERKAQEKRKKARDRRRVLKERDRHRQRKQKVKAKPEASQEPDSSEEWEERKYLLAQKRVEALRLLRVLLKNISVRLFPSGSSILGSTQLNSREVNIIDHEANYTPRTTLKTMEEEELNTQLLPNQEDMPKYQVAKSDNKQKQKKKKRSRAHLHKSSHFSRGKKIRYSSRKEKTGKLLTDEYNYHLVSDQNSLHVTMIQDQSLEKEEHHSSSKSYSSILSEIDYGRKQKIYETDEFINYLLNYFQTPKYARICLEPTHLSSTCEWHRDVHAKGNGFQITLIKHEYHSTNLSQMENLERKGQIQDDYWLMVCTQDPKHKPQKRGKVDYTKEYTKKLKNDCKDIASDAGDQLSPADGENYLLKKIHTYQSQSTRKSQGSSPISSTDLDFQLTDFLEETCWLSPTDEEHHPLQKTPTHQDKYSQSTTKSQVSSPISSADFDLQLTDFLEEISSDSECFSDTLSISKEEKEKSVTAYRSSPEKGTLDTDEIVTCKQKTRSSQQTSYSEWKHENEEKYSTYNLRTPGKRSKYEVKCSWLGDENSSLRDEKNNSKNRGKLSSKYLFDEGYSYESSSSNQLEDIPRKRRRASSSTLDQEVDYRPSHVPTTPSKSANVRLGYFPQRRETPQKSDYNQNTRRLKVHDSSKDFMFDSDNYYFRRISQEDINYEGYLGNSDTSSSNFQMF